MFWDYRFGAPRLIVTDLGIVILSARHKIVKIIGENASSIAGNEGLGSSEESNDRTDKFPDEIEAMTSCGKKGS